MKLDDYRAILDRIRTAEADTERTENLLTLETDYAEITGENERLQSEVDELTKRVADYAKLNNELFLANRKTQTTEHNKNENADTDNKEEPKKLEYSGLNFDD